MTKSVRFHYRFQTVVFNYVGSVALAIVLLFYRDMPTTYFGFLKTPVGLSVVYALAGVVITIILMRTPNFLRAIARIPIVDWDGETLSVRDGPSRTFRVSESVSIVCREEPEKNRIAIVSGSETAHVYCSHVDGPRSLVRFLHEIGSTPGGQENAGITTPR